MVSAPIGDLSEGLETPVQLLYLVTLLGFLVVGAYLVVRQVSSLSSNRRAKSPFELTAVHPPPGPRYAEAVCIGSEAEAAVTEGRLPTARRLLQVLVRRELEEAAKVLGERIRTNDASPEVRPAVVTWVLGCMPCQGLQMPSDPVLVHAHAAPVESPATRAVYAQGPAHSDY